MYVRSVSVSTLTLYPSTIWLGSSSFFSQFVNVLDPELQWTVSPRCEHFYEARDRSNTMRWTGSAVDLVFGSNSQLRAISEVYASDDGSDLFVRDFVAAWGHVMNLGRFD